jgi:cob(I)alamin adenosyltransferase
MDKGKYKPEKLKGALKPITNELFDVNYDVNTINLILKKVELLELKLNLLSEDVKRNNKLAEEILKRLPDE